jgi:hypothetical protein
MALLAGWRRVIETVVLLDSSSERDCPHDERTWNPPVFPPQGRPAGLEHRIAPGRPEQSRACRRPLTFTRGAAGCAWLTVRRCLTRRGHSYGRCQSSPRRPAPRRIPGAGPRGGVRRRALARRTKPAGVVRTHRPIVLRGPQTSSAGTASTAARLAPDPCTPTPSPTARNRPTSPKAGWPVPDPRGMAGPKGVGALTTAWMPTASAGVPFDEPRYRGRRARPRA